MNVLIRSQCSIDGTFTQTCLLFMVSFCSLPLFSPSRKGSFLTDASQGDERVSFAGEQSDETEQHMYYIIRIKDHLDVAWQSKFDDLSLQHEDAGTTLLSGNIPDQPALYGIVLKLSQMGVTLLSLQAEERGQPEDGSYPFRA
jgi:hypothetical protein